MVVSFLLVTNLIGTQVFVTWQNRVQNSVAKQFFKKVCARSGEHVLRRALANTHFMNTWHAMLIHNGKQKNEIDIKSHGDECYTTL